MSSLNLTQHMTTDEVVKLMENAIELTQNEQILLAHLTPRTHPNMNSPFIKEAISEIGRIEDCARDIMNMADDVIASLKSFRKSSVAVQPYLNENS